ncbi:MAG: sigma-E processing peptidase SpoIIGA [Clostridia bacterium]|nr:sigma-E processing peptidase SpoIIGA [Clostridia bacterium]
MIVYADVLFLINFIINVLLLQATALLGKCQRVAGRMIFGAALGAVYAVCMFFPRLHLFYTLLFKLVFGSVLMALVFRPVRLSAFLRISGIFYAVSFLFGGAVFGVMLLTDAGIMSRAIIQNGVLYFDLPAGVLFGTVSLCLLGVWVWRKTAPLRLRKQSLYREVQVSYDGKTVSLQALVDTGNTLTDPLTLTPVMIAELDALRELLPPCPTFSIEELSVGAMATRLRVIPFTSLGTKHGLLLGFRPDAVTIAANTYYDVVVGLYEHHLSDDRSYNALVGADLIV